MTDVTDQPSTPPPGILNGVSILEIGHFIAAPFATRLLGDLGADIIKIEPLSGDPARQWGEQVNDKSLWWSVHGRNKRSVAIDLKKPAARQIILDLARQCDAVVENFRPGQLTKLGFAPDVLRQANPQLIIAQISGYGQTGPYRDKAAFGVIGEAIGGLRHLTNHRPGSYNLPPVRVGVSIGDSIAGLYAAFGIVAALWSRDNRSTAQPPLTLDVALTESVLSMMEGMLPEYGALGKIKEPTGGGIATTAPTNAYPTANGEWILIAANSDPLFAKLMALMGRADLIGSHSYLDNQARVQNCDALDRLISDWTREQTIDALIDALGKADIPSSRVFSAADCATDPQYRFRGMVRAIADPAFDMPILHSGIVPHITERPGAVRWPGPAIGAHTEEVLGEIVSLTAEQIADLRSEGVIL